MEIPASVKEIHEDNGWFCTSLEYIKNNSIFTKKYLHSQIDPEIQKAHSIISELEIKKATLIGGRRIVCHLFSYHSKKGVDKTSFRCYTI